MTLQNLKTNLLTRPEILCVVMLAGLLPLTYQFVLFHPDEQHYVDAGIKMLESGDYLTPLTPEGELRLRKPIIPYSPRRITSAPTPKSNTSPVRKSIFATATAPPAIRPTAVDSIQPFHPSRKALG